MPKGEKLKGHGFEANPQNINRKGRPKITVQALLSEIKKAGGKVLSRQDIKELYLSLLDYTEEELHKIIANKDVSMITRIVGKAMLEKRGFDIIERMLDRSVGKPTQVLGEDNEMPFTTLADAFMRIDEETKE